MSQSEELDWRPLAERLAGRLVAGGFIRNGRLRDAFAATPRHVFVPRILDHGFEGSSQQVAELTVEDPAWLDAVYSDEALITQYKPLSDDPGTLMPTSSSTRPSLMADMIEELGIESGMRILESGTGTGYNAAILCHLLGESNVTTLDIDPELVSIAQSRLAELDYHPAVRPDDHTYDRILATHAVERIPSEWIRWGKPGCEILVDLRSRDMPDIGAWAHLVVDPDGSTATGRLMPDRGAFMNARRTVEEADGHARPQPARLDDLRRRSNGMVEPGVLNETAFAMALWHEMPDTTWQCFEADGELHANIASSDGRWADVTATSVMYTCFGDLWAEVEDRWDAWNDAGRSGLADYVIRTTSDGQTVIGVG